MRNKNILLGVIAAAVVILVVVIALSSHKSSNISLIVSPAAATAKLDGERTVQPGEFYVTPGKHTIDASFNGFSQTHVSFTAGSSGIQKVYVILQPSSQAGYDYLTNHPGDQKTREGYGGQHFSAQANDLATNNPIIKYLPFIGPGSAAFKIDYSFPKNGSNKVTVIVTYYTDAGKTYALNWLHGKGYDTSSPNLLFVDAKAAYKSSGY